MKRLVIWLTLICAASACAGEIEQLFQEQQPREMVQEAKDYDPQVREIGLERTACFGTCPIYSVILKKDGSFRYNGVGYTQRKGIHTGHIGERSFERLARLACETDFMHLPTNYAVSATDLPASYTTVVMSGKRHTVCDYGEAGPARLWALRQLIDQAVAGAQWDDPNPRDGSTHKR